MACHAPADMLLHTGENALAGLLFVQFKTVITIRLLLAVADNGPGRETVDFIFYLWHPLTDFLFAI